MTYTIVGLGNPGEEYQNTRHNVGRMVLEGLRKAIDATPWKENGDIQASVSTGKVEKHTVKLIEPETFMNNSGKTLRALFGAVKGPKAVEKISKEFILVHDDLDLPLGRLKISFNKSAGGHKGVQSVIKAVGTEAFVRIRIGISPATPKGVLKKPATESEMNEFIVGEFKPKELEVIKASVKRAVEGILSLIKEGKAQTMSVFNAQ